MKTMEALPAFLVWCLFQSPIPTVLLGLAKLAGLFPYAWPWVGLPTASASFFIGSFLLAGAITKTAYAMAKRNS